MKMLVYILSSFFIVGCNSKETPLEHLLNPYDLNDDGIEDVTNEKTDDGYYELVDRNFDGKVDESNFYNKSGKIQKSRFDDDFDGYLETEILYKHESVYFISVDSDKDKNSDIFYFYNFGSLKRGVKYYANHDGSKGIIGTITFQFGYPSKEIRSESKLSQKQFAEENFISVQKFLGK